MQVQDVVAFLDELTTLEPKDFANREDLKTLVRQKARFEAFTALVAAAFAESGDWGLDGARTSAHWLGVEGHMPKRRAKQLISQGKRATKAPLFEEAWLAGEISGDHLAAMGKAFDPKLAELFARDEEELLGHAKKLRFDDFERVAKYWHQLADPDGADASELERQARRNFSLAPTVDGMVCGTLTLDPVSGAIVTDELNRIAEGLFAADWCEAKARLGREPTTADLARTPGQRRADALVEMATRSNTAPADGRRPAPLFSILIDFDTFRGRMCQLANGTVVSPIVPAQWVDEAYIERAVMTPSRRVEVAPAVRFFTGATRRAIELRDRRCSDKYCYAPVENCEADHVEPYSKGGPTTQENGRLLCAFHNRRRNNQRPPPAA